MPNIEISMQQFKMSKKSTDTQEKMLDVPSQKDNKPPNKFYQFFMQGKVVTVNKQETNNVSLIINAFCQFFFLVHILVAQQLISQEQIGPYLNTIISSAISEVLIYKILQALSVVLKLLIIQSIYMDITNGQQIIGFSWLKKVIFKSFFTIKEVDILLSGYLLYVSWYQNLPLYLFSLLIDGFYAIYLQNYIIRKDLFYITSSFQNILLRISMAISTGSNIILVNIGNQFSFTIYHIFFVSGLFIWYFIWGKKIYTHPLINKSLMFMVTVYGAFAFSMVEKLFTGFPVIDVGSICKLILSFVVLTAFFILGERKSRTYINANYDGMIKNYQLYISELAQKSINDQDAEALLFGKLQFHFFLESPNQRRDSQREDIFDPVLKMEINPRQFATQRDSCSRFYCKSLYESALAHDPLNKKMLLDYSEFLFNQIKNMYSLMQILQKIEGMNLNIIEKTKVSKFKLMIKQQNSRLNSDLYDGKLQLQNIIQSQQCFCQIQTKIIDYLEVNLQIWSFFLGSEIDMSYLHKKLVQNFQLIEQTTKQWMKISKYFHIHKQWKFTYLNFLLFIKNQHIKLKQFDSAKEDRNGYNTSIFDSQKIILDDVNISSIKLFTEDILFNEDSFCIKTHLENGQLVIHQVSRYFERNTMYNSDQIKGTLLEELMPVDIRENHSKVVLKWISEGYLTDDTAYKVQSTKCLKKNGDDFPVIKYYKSYCHIQNGLQFVCLLKQNMRQQIIDDDSSKRQTPAKRRSALLKNIHNQQFMSIQQLDDQFKPMIEPKNFQSQSNIFIKEETLQPPIRFYIGQHFKRSSRIFTMTMIISIVVLLLINQSDTSNLISYGNQFIAFMNMYRFPVVLGTNYMKSFLNVGNAKTVASQIASATSSMQTYTSLPTTMKTLFDPTLVVPVTYSPYYQYPWMGNLTYNQIDLFYVIYSSISSLNQLPINRTGVEFQKFNSFLRPSYDAMMNSTKYQLQAKFQTLFTTMLYKQMWFMLTQGFIFLIFVVVTFYYVHNSIKKMKNVLLILLDLTLPDVQKITDYWAKLSRSFSSIFLQMHNEGGSTKHLSNRRIRHLTDKFVQQHNRKTMSSSKPMIVEGKTRGEYQCRLRLLIVLMTALIFVMALCLEVNIILSIIREQSFQKDGFYFLRYFPTGPLVGYGCMQKYYSLLYPSEITFNPDRYADVMSSMYLFGQFQYIGSITNPSSLYYAKQKNYFFGNPCQYNPSLLTTINVTVATCQTISNSTFKQGCSSFLRYGSKIGESYMKGQITMTAAQIQNYTSSVNILSTYVLDAITTWLNEFSGYVNADFQNNLTISIVILVLIIILHIVINEIIIASKISKDYKFICKVYDHLVPEYILINQKVIRQKFVIEGLINE